MNLTINRYMVTADDLNYWAVNCCAVIGRQEDGCRAQRVKFLSLETSNLTQNIWKLYPGCAHPEKVYPC